MPPSSPDDEFSREEIERRREVRGVFPGLEIEIFGAKAARFAAVEASRRGFFVPVEDPEYYLLGEIHEATIRLRDKTSSCRMEVFRKELEPRRGIALRVAIIDPRNEEALKSLLGWNAE